MKTHTIDASSSIEVRYTYDISNPGEFGSANNRLMKAEKYDVIVASLPGGMMMQGFGFGPTYTLVSTKYYSYNGSGNVTRIDTALASVPEGQPDSYSTMFHYAANEKAVTFVYGQTSTSPTTAFAREFWYGERSERERAAIGKASRDARVRPATCPKEVSTKRTTGGGLVSDIATSNWTRSRFRRAR